MLKKLLSSLLAALALAPTGYARADDTGAILDQLAAVYGSQAPAAMRVSGSTISFSRGEGTLERLFKAPDRFRNAVKYATGTEVRTMIGPMVWYHDKPANPALRAAIALQAARVALPWNLLAQRASVHDLGSSEVDGQAVQTLEFSLEPTLKMVLQVALGSGHIVESRGIMIAGERTMEFTTKYSDFHSAGGRTYAGREEQYAMGQHIGHTRIERVDYLDTLADSAFAPWTTVYLHPRDVGASGDTVLALR